LTVAVAGVDECVPLLLPDPDDGHALGIRDVAPGVNHHRAGREAHLEKVGVLRPHQKNRRREVGRVAVQVRVKTCDFMPALAQVS